MYMAIFSGGRWIRQQLAAAGPKFWTGQVNLPSPFSVEKQDSAWMLDLPGFSFLSFEGEQDGEDIKTLYKTRLGKADALLTEEEKSDVIEAAQEIFEHCIGIVGILDGLVLKQKSMERVPKFAAGFLTMLGLFLLYWVDAFGYLRS